MRAIDAALAHYRRLATRHFDVPEWAGPDGKPLRIFYTPLTVLERQELWVTAGEPKNDVDLVILKARDEQGDPLFTLEDKQPLLRAVDSATLSRIARAMVAFTNVEQAGKNSGAIPSGS